MIYTIESDICMPFFQEYVSILKKRRVVMRLAQKSDKIIAQSDFECSDGMLKYERILSRSVFVAEGEMTFGIFRMGEWHGRCT